jgi:NAD(P)-dependent dehydrogenase (short-subunit alcohol dehydrogenase family)
VARHRVALGGGGRIVTFASSATFQSGGAGQASLNAAMLSLTSAAALTLGEHGVPVNCVVLGGTDSAQGGVPQPDVEGAEIIGSTVVHLAASADPAVTGRYVYCAGRDVGLYAMPLVIESANVLMRFSDDIDPETVGHLLTPLVDVGRS